MTTNICIEREHLLKLSESCEFTLKDHLEQHPVSGLIKAEMLPPDDHPATIAYNKHKALIDT